MYSMFDSRSLNLLYLSLKSINNRSWLSEHFPLLLHMSLAIEWTIPYMRHSCWYLFIPNHFHTSPQWMNEWMNEWMNAFDFCAAVCFKERGEALERWRSNTYSRDFSKSRRLIRCFQANVIKCVMAITLAN